MSEEETEILRTTMKEFHNWLTDLYDEEKGKKTKNKHKEDWKQEDMQEDWEQGAMQAKNGQGQRWKGTAAFSKASTWVDLHPPFPWLQPSITRHEAHYVVLSKERQFVDKSMRIEHQLNGLYHHGIAQHTIYNREIELTGTSTVLNSVFTWVNVYSEPGISCTTCWVYIS